VRTETTSGIGRIWRDGRLALDAAGYAITYQVAEAPDVADIDLRTTLTFRHASGRLRCSFPQWLVGREVELELQDGWWWRCRIESFDGVLSDRGGLYLPPASRREVVGSRSI
jgi:hypothetical protein